MKLMRTCIILLLLAAAWAQPLSELLPADTALALGAVGLAEHQDKLAPFIAEAERLALAEALAAAFGSELAMADAELTLLDLLGQEAWLALSLSRFNPLPAITLIARLSPRLSAQIADSIAQTEGLSALSEGGLTFYQLALPEPLLTVSAVAFAQLDDIVVLSSNPDSLRAVLRQLEGSAEPSLADRESYRATLGSLAPGTLYGYLDYGQIASSLAPLARGLGFDQLIRRLEQSLTTAGVSAGVLRVTADGLEQESLQRPDAAGGDAQLYALLTDSAMVAPDASGIPAGVLSWSHGVNALPDWWRYLNGLAGSTPELGGSLDELAQLLVGIELSGTLFNWMGPAFTSVSTGVGEVVQPGVASENLLGENVYRIATGDPQAAEAGLRRLLERLGASLAAFTDPLGRAGSAALSSEAWGDLTVTSAELASGITVSYTVTDDAVLIATSPAAMQQLLAGGTPLSETPQFSRLTALAPARARSYSLSDDARALRESAAQLGSQLQLLAGLGGAQTLDFDAVEQASAALEAYLEFIAERLGTSYSYSALRDGVIYRYSLSEVRW